LESNEIMKRNILLCLSLLLILSQIQFANAASKTYVWNNPPGYNESFEIYLEAEDNWQTEVTTTVLARVTLLKVGTFFDSVVINWIKIELTTLKFSVDSGNVEIGETMRNVGDHFEKRIDFLIPADRLNRGENVDLAMIWSMNIDILDSLQHRHWIYTGSGSNDPITVSLYRPFLSTLEWLMVGIVVCVTVGGSIGFVIYRRVIRRRRVTPIEPSPPR